MFSPRANRMLKVRKALLIFFVKFSRLCGFFLGDLRGGPRPSWTELSCRIVTVPSFTDRSVPTGRGVPSQTQRLVSFRHECVRSVHVIQRFRPSRDVAMAWERAWALPYQFRCQRMVPMGLERGLSPGSQFRPARHIPLPLVFRRDAMFRLRLNGLFRPGRHAPSGFVRSQCASDPCPGRL